MLLVFLQLYNKVLCRGRAPPLQEPHSPPQVSKTPVYILDATDSLEPLVMIVKFLHEISGVFRHPKHHIQSWRYLLVGLALTSNNCAKVTVKDAGYNKIFRNRVLLNKHIEKAKP